MKARTHDVDSTSSSAPDKHEEIGYRAGGVKGQPVHISAISTYVQGVILCPFIIPKSVVIIVCIAAITLLKLASR